MLFLLLLLLLFLLFSAEAQEELLSLRSATAIFIHGLCLHFGRTLLNAMQYNNHPPFFRGGLFLCICVLVCVYVSSESI